MPAHHGNWGFEFSAIFLGLDFITPDAPSVLTKPLIDSVISSASFVCHVNTPLAISFSSAIFPAQVGAERLLTGFSGAVSQKNISKSCAAV
jgi:hypothetical protein